ncbi:MAG: nickel-dependent lactate racemase [Candidatus Zixiibacteriota bacterium]
MELKIKYAGKDIDVKLPNRANIDIIQPDEISIADESRTIQKALESNCEFQEFIENYKDFTIIVNDSTRSTPTAKIIAQIENYLQSKDFRFIVAVGTHRPPTEFEMKTIFGHYLEKYRDRILVHDSRNKKNLVKIGKSPTGNEFWINKHALESEAIIVIGSVEPHYFAGFTGGRKSILPGIAGYETIRQNHSFAMDNNAKIMALENNYLHHEMELAAKSIQLPMFSIQAVLDRHQNIYRIISGDISDSFYQAVEYAKKVYAAAYTSQYDIVIAEVNPPMDINLYQSHKALEHVKQMCKDNGIIILVSKCKDGIGQSDFYDMLSSGKTASQICKEIDNFYKLGSHKSYRLAKLLENKRVWAFTDIEPNILRKINIKPIESLENAIYNAIDGFENEVELALVKDATATVPQKCNNNRDYSCSSL